MVCPRCTLLQPTGMNICRQCGALLRPPLESLTIRVAENASTSIGIVSSVSLLTCLFIALVLPAAASQALAIGAYIGIISITNVWLSVYKGETGEWQRGLRGVGYSGALLVSLVAEIARMQHLASLPLPALAGLPASIPVPSAIATELLAATLIVVDPLVVRPLIRWIEEGVEHSEPNPYASPE